MRTISNSKCPLRYVGTSASPAAGPGTPNPLASPWYRRSRQTIVLATSAISAVKNSGRIMPRLAVVSVMMMTAVSGARTTPTK